MRTLRGEVTSGKGDFAYWLDRLRDLYKDKTGMDLFPGTLNVRLAQPFDLPQDRVIRLEAEEYGGSVSVSLLPCSILGRKAFILRTDQNAKEEGDHPRSVIEVATDIKLRDEYGLEDGDIVEVDIGRW